MHLAQIVARVDGDVYKLKNQGSDQHRPARIASESQHPRRWVDIPAEAHEIVGDRPVDLWHDANSASRT